jgi:hypothetical protein
MMSIIPETTRSINEEEMVPAATSFRRAITRGILTREGECARFVDKQRQATGLANSPQYSVRCPGRCDRVTRQQTLQDAHGVKFCSFDLREPAAAGLGGWGQEPGFKEGQRRASTRHVRDRVSPVRAIQLCGKAVPAEPHSAPDCELQGRSMITQSKSDTHWLPLGYHGPQGAGDTSLTNLSGCICGQPLWNIGRRHASVGRDPSGAGTTSLITMPSQSKARDERWPQDETGELILKDGLPSAFKTRPNLTSTPFATLNALEDTPRARTRSHARLGGNAVYVKTSTLNSDRSKCLAYQYPVEPSHTLFVASTSLRSWLG